ncbi:hypothetical protein D3C78_1084340 [compost metagenome]
MGNGATRGHPADVPGLDPLIRAKAVLVQDLAFEQVGEGRKADMRMLTDVHAIAGGVIGFEHVIEKHERSDTATLCRRQGAQDRLALDGFGARVDDQGIAHGGLQAGDDELEHNLLQAASELHCGLTGLPCLNRQQGIRNVCQKSGLDPVAGADPAKRAGAGLPLQRCTPALRGLLSGKRRHGCIAQGHGPGAHRSVDDLRCGGGEKMA